MSDLPVSCRAKTTSESSFGSVHLCDPVLCIVKNFPMTPFTLSSAVWGWNTGLDNVQRSLLVGTETGLLTDPTSAQIGLGLVVADCA